MDRDSLVAINIVNSNNNILNKTTVPMLYYWNGESDIMDDLANDNELIDYVKTLISEPTDYLNIFISYFYFRYNDNNEEVYSDTTIEVQNLIFLDKIENDNICIYYINKHFRTLYKNSFKQEFVSTSEDDITNIIDIFRAIKSKFKTRISKQTIVNWVRSVLLEESKFNSTNSDYIINKLNEILISEE